MRGAGIAFPVSGPTWLKEMGETPAVYFIQLRTPKIWLPRWHSSKKKKKKNLPAKTGLILGSRRSLGGGNGNPFQYSCLENPIDGGAWQATVHGVAKSQSQVSD